MRSFGMDKLAQGETRHEQSNAKPCPPIRPHIQRL